MTTINPKLTALIATIAVAAPASGAEAASQRYLTQGHFHSASIARHYSDLSKLRPISPVKRLRR
jgi:hypothetical protein